MRRMLVLLSVVAVVLLGLLAAGLATPGTVAQDATPGAPPATRSSAPGG